MVSPERAATSGATEPSLGLLYADLRNTFQISWVPSTFDALGEVPAYLRCAWSQLAPSAQTAQFARLAQSIQQDCLAAVRSLYLPSYDAGVVQQLGISLADLAMVRTELEALIFGQSQELVAVKALRLAIENQPPGGEHKIAWPRQRTTWSMEPISSITAGSTGSRVQQVFDEAQASLGLGCAPRSLQVLAGWPTYLDLAWNDLTSALRTPEFTAAQTDLIEESAARCALLPTTIAATPDWLASRGIANPEIRRAREILLEHDRLLPANLLVTTCLRYPLGGNLPTSRARQFQAA